MSGSDGPQAGIDVGTSGVRSVAIDHEGAVLAPASEAYPPSTPHGLGGAGSGDCWRATVSILTELRREAGIPAGIGLAGQMHGLVAHAAAGARA